MNVASITNILLSILPRRPIKTKSLQHGFIIETIQIHRRAACRCEVLILIPRWDTERITLLPLYALSVYLGMARTLDDVIDR